VARGKPRDVGLADDLMKVDKPLLLSAASRQLDCRVLLVEDDRDHQPLLSMMLQKSGCEVIVANNGKEAIERVRSARDAGQPFDLILMDLQMPVLDGLTATRTIRAEGFANPIVALTARAISTDREESFAAGCDGFLSKPMLRTELVRSLAAHLDHSQRQPHAVRH
jgi:CheY-like chemotaxis protein